MTDLVSKIKTLEVEIARNAPTKKALAIITAVSLAQVTAFVGLIGPYGLVFWLWGVTDEVGVVFLRFVFTVLYAAIAALTLTDLWSGDAAKKSAELQKQLEEARTALANHSEWS